MFLEHLLPHHLRLLVLDLHSTPSDRNSQSTATNTNPPIQSLVIMFDGSLKRRSKMSRNMSFPPRRNQNLSFEELAVGFDIGHLERLLCRDLLPWTTQTAQFQGLARRCQAHSNFHVSSSSSPLGPYTGALEEVVAWLCSFLERPVSQELPPILLAQVHTAIGLIRQSARNYDEATRSHLHAAWILTHSNEDDGDISSKQHLAVCLYRLGTLYGRLGRHKEMQSTLRKAFDVYAGRPQEEVPTSKLPRSIMCSMYSEPLWTVEEGDEDSSVFTRPLQANKNEANSIQVCP